MGIEDAIQLASEIRLTAAKLNELMAKAAAQDIDVDIEVENVKTVDKHHPLIKMEMSIKL